MLRPWKRLDPIRRQPIPTEAEIAAMLAAFHAAGRQVTRLPAAYAAPCTAVRIDPEARAIATRTLAAAPAANTLPPAEAAALRVLRELATRHASGVPICAWREACQAPESGITPAGTPNSRRQGANLAIRTLAGRRVVIVRDGLVREAGASTGRAPGLPGAGTAERQPERVAV
ncbi:MAG TPA: hypothetical protein VND19_06480 [Acetobacteraceae bacterium]|nr:hypothetical protein [Acetobacteraceae bacterium]